MKRNARIQLFALLGVLAAAGGPVLAQRSATDAAALRAGIERKFDVLLLRDGLALRPRDASRGITSIEVTDGPIAIDGQLVSGSELRQRLGDDADLILQLSYMSADARRAAFESTTQASRPSLAPPPAPEPPSPPESTRRRSMRRSRNGNGNDIVRFGRSVTINEGEVVDGDVVAIGGPVRVDGEVRGDVVAVGGGITLGPGAYVTDNVVSVGGSLHRDQAARIDGKISEIGGFDFGDMDWSRAIGPMWMGSWFSSTFRLMTTLTHAAVLCLLTALVLLIAQQYADRASLRASTDTARAFAVGFLAEVLFLPVLVITIVVLTVTIIGIPLLLLIPFALLGLMILALVGFTGVAHYVGEQVGRRFGWDVNNPYSTTILGVLAVMSPLLLARIIGLVGFIGAPFSIGLALLGWIVYFGAWTVGFGSVALMRFSRSVPPMPSQTTVTV